MEKRFHIFLTDGYSMDPVHARNGGIHYSGRGSSNGGVSPPGKAKLAPAVPEKA